MKKLMIFLIAILILNLAMNLLFAEPQVLKEIKKIEDSTREKTPIIIRPRMEYNAEGLRDPFQGRLGDSDLAESGVQAPPDLNIQGIVWGGSFPQAIINNRVVKIGDAIDQAKIIDITKDGVAVFYKGRQYNLYSPAAVELQKKEKSEGGKDEK